VSSELGAQELFACRHVLALKCRSAVAKARCHFAGIVMLYAGFLHPKSFFACSTLAAPFRRQPLLTVTVEDSKVAHIRLYGDAFSAEYGKSSIREMFCRAQAASCPRA